MYIVYFFFLQTLTLFILPFYFFNVCVIENESFRFYITIDLLSKLIIQLGIFTIINELYKLLIFSLVNMLS
jgi:hypothetical protein